LGLLGLGLLGLGLLGLGLLYRGLTCLDLMALGTTCDELGCRRFAGSLCPRPAAPRSAFVVPHTVLSATAQPTCAARRP
jgi:hypothetical protein